MTATFETIPTTDTERLQSLGGAAKLSREMRDYQDRIRVLNQRHSELASKYPDQWVALASNGTLVAAPTMQEIISKVEARGLRRAGLAVKFTGAAKRRMIL